MTRTKVTSSTTTGDGKARRGHRKGNIRKRRKYRPGTVTLREIRKYQTSTETLIPKLSFQRLVKETMTYVCEERGVPMMKIQSAALLALQTASEDYLTNLFSKSQLAAIHGKRITVTPKDVQLVRCFSGESFYKHLKNTTGTSTD